LVGGERNVGGAHQENIQWAGLIAGDIEGNSKDAMALYLRRGVEKEYIRNLSEGKGTLNKKRHGKMARYEW